MDTQRCRKLYVSDFMGWECCETREHIAKCSLAGLCSHCHASIEDEAANNASFKIDRFFNSKSFQRVPGMFTRLYPDLHGKDWLRHLPQFDRILFSAVGRYWSGYGRLGGIVRALTASRDSRGRFVKTEV